MGNLATYPTGKIYQKVEQPGLRMVCACEHIFLFEDIREAIMELFGEIFKNRLKADCSTFC